MKKQLITLFVLLCMQNLANADLASLALEIFKTKDNTIEVNMYSSLEMTSRKNLSIQEAQGIIQHLKNRSGFVVAIVVDRLQLADYLPILESVSKNSLLDLKLIRQKRLKSKEDRLIMTAEYSKLSIGERVLFKNKEIEQDEASDR